MLALPRPIREALGDPDLVPNTTGRSGTAVYRVGSLYLKAADTRKDKDELRHETRLLGWLHGRLPVPEVVSSAEANGRVYLLMTELPGTPAHEALHGNKEGTIRLLAEGLKLVHSIDPATCPFSAALDLRLEQAKQHVDEGLVDEGDFDSENAGRSARDIHEQLLRERPCASPADIVFTHGDYCLPNIILQGDLAGFIDWGRGGVSDRYQDLALALRSLRYNLEWLGDRQWQPELATAFLTAYGLERVDEAKATYYRLLDELF